MPKFTHRSLTIIAGGLWLAIGIFLLTFGIHLILSMTDGASLTGFVSKYFSSRDVSIIAIITMALFIGHLKGKYVLSKSVDRQLNRISSLPNPALLSRLFGKGYYILIGSMILLGMSLRFLPISQDIRGSVDVAIGSALINGALLYFRSLTRFTLAAKK